ncbi:MAG: hypothetical protein OEM77_03275 [Nitrosopumilus sp.]|nr:hypothetical protein [Nitrosopumilus sp.]MDH3736619.1 hypothetical protein [Nitrosopumilus sp.]MDH3823312.1 hypothetical protein [Nitrosopumilus sp.]MDH3833526.1 hypothetical protein [Nitrosopumilus sp.]
MTFELEREFEMEMQESNIAPRNFNTTITQDETDMGNFDDEFEIDDDEEERPFEFELELEESLDDEEDQEKQEYFAERLYMISNQEYESSSDRDADFEEVAEEMYREFFLKKIGKAIGKAAKGVAKVAKSPIVKGLVKFAANTVPIPGVGAAVNAGMNLLDKIPTSGKDRIQRSGDRERKGSRIHARRAARRVSGAAKNALTGLAQQAINGEFENEFEVKRAVVRKLKQEQQKMGIPKGLRNNENVRKITLKPGQRVVIGVEE